MAEIMGVIQPNKSYLRYVLTKGYRKLANRLIQVVYQDDFPDPSRSILVVGSPRSGTTWLTDVIASQAPSRIMFEPFNPNLVHEYRNFNYFQYMRPGDENQELFDFAQKIFSGAIRNTWIDREVNCITPLRRVIKDVRSSLMLKWLDVQFPEVPKVFIVRHPCAVVLSRLKLGWATDDDIRHLLNQPNLMQDYLDEKLETIKRATSDEQKHAIIWCITNLIPIRQYQNGGLNLFYYEKLVQNPEIEIRKLFGAIHAEFQNSVLEKVDRPSMTTIRSSAIISGRDKINQWRNELTPRQIDIVLEIVDQMGLGDLVSPIT